MKNQLISRATEILTDLKCDRITTVSSMNDRCLVTGNWGLKRYLVVMWAGDGDGDGFCEIYTNKTTDRYTYQINLSEIGAKYQKSLTKKYNAKN